ncbi:apolipoprotein N-acyltransferase [Silanimonas lenta]|uniref:apolipoprotein N-acyltransferase n=1 Tax=Silanimonas lenta TaxID=265429 RepID=UPI0004162FC3|nr:apolipoprotein N-acyltransferase [Silanimonas lenta]
MTPDPSAGAWLRPLRGQRLGPFTTLLAGILASALLLSVYAHVEAAWPLGFVLLVPWLLVLDRARSGRGVLLSALLMGFAFSAAAFAWFGAALGTFTGLGSLAGIALVVLAGPLLQPQLLAFALVRWWARGHGPALRALAAAAAWVASEALLPKLLGDTLGHGLHGSAWLRQAADLGGATGLTVVLLLANEALARAWQQRHAGAARLARPLLAAVSLAAGLALYGAWRLPQVEAAMAEAASAPALRVAMVQSNLTDYERRRRESSAYDVVREVLDTHYALGFSAIRDHGAEALLWSETVYPTTFGQPRSEDAALLDREIQGFVDVTGVPLVFGSYERDARGEYNVAVFLEPGRGLLGRYRKTHPFPLTEHVPDWLEGPAFRRLLPWAGGWRAGDGARVLPLRHRDGREVEVLPLICLDDTRPGLALEGARQGAQALLGLSNDSWFTHTPQGARLHLAVARFRSIETRLPQLRVTTNGLSAIVDASGAVVARTEMGQQAVLTGTISAASPLPTLMVAWGDWVGRAGAGLLAVLGLLGLWRRFAPAPTRPWPPERLRLPPGGVATAGLPVLYAPGWARLAIALLRVVAGLGLVALTHGMATRIGWQVQSLSQLTLYASAVLTPLVLAWALGHAFRARLGLEGGSLVIEGRRQRTEVPLASITGVQPWALPLPLPGGDLVLASGRRLGIGSSELAALRAALGRGERMEAAGSPADEAGLPLLARLASARQRARRPGLDHGLLKFGLFPLLPALVAFRLHQVIAFGGPFGEWLTYGPGAWLSGLLLWWGAWSLGLMLLAAALRLLVEAFQLAAALLAPSAAQTLREGSEWLARLVFYAGVPLWLGWRLLAA